MKQFLQRVVEGSDLSRDEMREAAREMFKEETPDVQIAGFLLSLRTKGETVDEIVGLVDVLQEKALPFSKKPIAYMDNCGTGGDGSQSFNVSTTSAFVLAAAGCHVAKHGNRSVTSRSGSADVLEVLNISLTLSATQTERVLQEANIAFLFAQHVHKSMKRVMKVRKDLGVPTILNLIGPLTNPLPLQYQVLGMYRGDLLEKFAHVLHELGRKRAVVIHGADGVDEASLSGENKLVFLEEGKIRTEILCPEDVGLARYSLQDIRGGDATQNAQLLQNILNGTAPQAYVDTVLFNAGIGLYVAEKANTIAEGVHLARQIIENSSAKEALETLQQSMDRIQEVAQ